MVVQPLLDREVVVFAVMREAHVEVLDMSVFDSQDAGACFDQSSVCANEAGSPVSVRKKMGFINP